MLLSVFLQREMPFANWSAAARGDGCVALLDRSVAMGWLMDCHILLRPLIKCVDYYLHYYLH